MRVSPLLAYLAVTAIAVAAADRKPTLLELAKEKFAPRKLTAAEVELFVATEKGDEASCLTYPINENEDDPAIAWTWNDRAIHAECLTWLCTDSEASKRVTYRGININGMRIDGRVDLSFAEISFPLQTWRCAFMQGIDLLYAHTRGLYFQTTYVHDLAADGAKIEGSVYLRSDFKADGQVEFKAAAITGDVDCSGGHFLAPISQSDGGTNAALSFNSAKIQGNVYLMDAFETEGEVDLVNSEMKGLSLRDLSGKKTSINLRSAKATILRDEQLRWPEEGHLFLDGFTYERIHGHPPFAAIAPVQWLRRQPHDTFLPQPYEQLASVLKNMGYEPEARKVMIEKNRDHATFTRPFSQEWWWYNVFGWLIGYGYAPSRAFFISLAMISLGYFLFKIGYLSSNQLILPTDEKGYQKDAAGKVCSKNGKREFSDDYPKFNAFIYSLESFTPLLKLDQSSYWSPNAKRGASFSVWRLRLTTGGLLRVYLWFHMIAGWVLTSLWVGGLTGLVKT
jgi:hypothetical protein